MIKWVVRLALITALLGFLGTLAIIFTTIMREDSTSKPPESHDTVSVASANSKSNIPDTTLLSKPPVPQQLNKQPEEQKLAPSRPEIVAQKIEAEKKVINIEVPAKKDDKKSLEKTTKKEDKKEKSKSEKVVTQKKQEDEKLFTQDELQQLVSRINSSKEKNSIGSNCVQINATKQGNNTRTLQQVETYLRSQGFAIAGREIVDKKVEGIQVHPNGGCIKITVGSF